MTRFASILLVLCLWEAASVTAYEKPHDEPAVDCHGVPNESLIKLATYEAHKKLFKTDHAQTELAKHNVTIAKGTPEYFSALLKHVKPEALHITKVGEVQLVLSKIVAQLLKLPKCKAEEILKKIPQNAFHVKPMCEIKKPHCNPKDKYRTIDGTCNNLKHVLWGSSDIPMNRLLPPDYSGTTLNLPRGGLAHSTLPSPRTVSLGVTKTTTKPSNRFTVMMMQWAQFLDHDLTHAPIAEGKYGDTIKCCDVPADLKTDKMNCFPIKVEGGDPFYLSNVTCMNFVRSAPAASLDCKLGARQQMNQLTSYIDGSNVYGSTKKEEEELRAYHHGLLKVIRHGDRDLPPDGKTEKCPTCTFKAGDSRVNEQPNLAVMHTLWLREHNRIAKELRELNPHWDDERLFQETRRIVGAELQHITYYEYLPSVLGFDFTWKQGLMPRSSGYTHCYDQHVDSTIINSFAAAAYRFGHTLVPDTLKGYSEDCKLKRELKLSDHFFKPSFLNTQENMDQMIRGLVKSCGEDFDNHFSPEIRNKLFANVEDHSGLDLVALNIQRGRDHGIPSYNKYREFCGLGKAEGFYDLEYQFSDENIDLLSEVYDSVDDVDLYVGGVLENKAPGALVSETFRCIMGEQFKRIKKGDRFYYENGEFSATRFTPEQLKQLRKASLARVVCDCSDRINMIQPWVFWKNTYWWNRKACCGDAKKIPRINLKFWKEDKHPHCKKHEL